MSHTAGSLLEVGDVGTEDLGGLASTPFDLRRPVGELVRRSVTGFSHRSVARAQLVEVTPDYNPAAQVPENSAVPDLAATAAVASSARLPVDAAGASLARSLACLSTSGHRS